ncbi:MAG: MalT-like region [Planctomycetota bacterium]|jgi:tetratricopeptide (TPR) repeat protein
MSSTPSFDPSPELGSDPCLQIQVDLSAMIDGELDPASVRRVLVHSDCCAGCRSFLRGIRDQVRLHRELVGIGELAGPDGSATAEPTTPEAKRLRRQLTENRRKLGRVLYELGRGFVLMGLSPDFSREVAKEPVPVPDMAQRGRSLLDDLSRAVGDGDPWVPAAELLDGQLRTPAENLAKGERLLQECLALESDHHEARIYLGLAQYVRGQRGAARQQFTVVLASATDPLCRAYALLNLGNIHLDEGDHDGAVQLLLALVESGIVEQQPRLSMSYFNLGLAYGLQGRFDECLRWFAKLHDELPHKRAAVTRELERRRDFVHLVHKHPDARAVAERFPAWFGPPVS